MRVYHPQELTQAVREIVPTPGHFARFALDAQGYLFVYHGDDPDDANPIHVYTGFPGAGTYHGICGYDGDRVYVEPVEGSSVLVTALNRVS